MYFCSSPIPRPFTSLSPTAQEKDTGSSHFELAFLLHLPEKPPSHLFLHKVGEGGAVCEREHICGGEHSLKSKWFARSW